MASGTKTVGPGKDYTSLSAWEAGEQANLTGTGPAIAECYSFEDTTAVTIDGWTTTAADYIRIYTPAAERHEGKWNAAKSRLVVDAGRALACYEEYFRAEGLQISINTTDRECLRNYATGTGVWYVSHCVLRQTVNNGYGFYDSTSGALSYKIWNCLFYDFGKSGLYLGNANATSSIYNITVHNCGLIGSHAGIYVASGTVIAVNCLLWRPTVAGTLPAIGTFAAGTNYQSTNHTSMGYTVTGGGNINDRVSQTFTFVDEAGDDFHLQSGDAGAKDYGVTDPGSGLFSDDIDGAARSAPWDIGADEYVAAGGPVIPVFMNQYRQRWN